MIFLQPNQNFGLKFTTTDVAARSTGIKALVYGKAGVGKTVLCSTAPRPLIVAVERGLLSLRTKAVPVAMVQSYEAAQELYRWVTGSLEARQIDTLCFDSLTDMGETLLAVEKSRNKDPRKAYGNVADQILLLVRAFLAIPEKHMYFSAKEEWSKDEATGVCKYQPMMPGQKLGPQLPYLFDEVFHMGVGKTPEGQSFRYLQTQPDLQYEAKDRSGILAPMEPPDLSLVFNKIQGV